MGWGEDELKRPLLDGESKIASGAGVGSSAGQAYGHRTLVPRPPSQPATRLSIASLVADRMKRISSRDVSQGPLEGHARQSLPHSSSTGMAGNLGVSRASLRATSHSVRTKGAGAIMHQEAAQKVG